MSGRGWTDEVVADVVSVEDGEMVRGRRADEPGR
jgi:hypothetical protein